MQFYLTLDEEGFIGLSPFPHSDKPEEKAWEYLLPGLPLEAARRLFFRNGLEKVKGEKAEILKILNKLTETPGQAWSWQPVKGSGLPDFIPVQLLNALRGRQLTVHELSRFVSEQGVKAEDFLHAVHRLVKAGMGTWLPGVSRLKTRWECQRCGEVEVQEWPGQYGREATCPGCSALGACTSLVTLYRDFRPLERGEELLPDIPPQAGLTLTEAQKIAAGQALDFYACAQDTEALIWAACGAGKTEVCFPTINMALMEGKGVLFAAPRQDVVHDVAPRLIKHFAGHSCQVLSGAVPRLLQSGQIVVATTHQVLRFYQTFDVIILDEVDAFPYESSDVLKRGIMRALKPGGKLLQLTATPDPHVLDRVKGGICRLIRLPARHHRHPLPVPVWKKGQAEGKGEMGQGLKELKSCLQETVEIGTTLVFVPLIAWVDPWVRSIARMFPSLRVAGSSSADQGRSDKIAGLKRGEWDIFVSTTILERGITVPQAQVIVLAADHPLFDVRALVQMAGRAGRTTGHPYGKVFFLSGKKNKAISQAVGWIEDQNRQAGELGLIDE